MISMTCPLKMAAREGADPYCDEDDCAGWCAGKNMCAVVLTALLLMHAEEITADEDSNSSNKNK
jgi:hypothetical protein